MQLDIFLAEVARVAVGWCAVKYVQETSQYHSGALNVYDKDIIQLFS